MRVLSTLIQRTGPQPASLDHRAAARLAHAAARHGVLPLAIDALTANHSGPWVDAAWQVVRRAAAADLVRERELRMLARGLADDGVPPLVIKGAHLAYAHYPRPDLRPRVDTDILVTPAQREQARATLEALGYERVPQLEADLVMYQQPYVKHLDGVPSHVVDLHWRVANAQRFADALTHQDLLATAQRLPGMAPAVGPSAGHALLLACVHRLAHHRDAPRLIWIYDIHRLATSLDAAAWSFVASHATERDVATACVVGLDASVQMFGTPVPEHAMAALRSAARREPSMRAFLDPGGRRVHRVLSDLAAIGPWHLKLRMARQHLLPPSAYMRTVYAPTSRAPLPVLYARRAWRGARRWFGR